jgi:hypothetical protein
MNLSWPIVKALLEREQVLRPGYELDTLSQANTFLLKHCQNIQGDYK